MITEFETILVQVGSYGRYQKLMVAFVLIPTSFFIALQVSTTIFQTVVPDKYWCDAPGREETNFTREEWWNLTVPRTESGDFEKCKHYSLSKDELPITASEYEYENTSVTVSCFEWEHDRSVFTETVATDMNWLCDKEIYSTHILSVNMAGNAVGTFILPIIADKLTGRRLMFYISSGIHLVFSLLFLVVPIYSIVLILRFFAGLSFQTNFQMPYLIGLELTCPDKRALVSFYSFVAWTMGMCGAALVSWLIPNWWYLVVINCVISLLFFGYWKFIPESPRWLLSKGKVDKSTAILMKVSRVNRVKEVDESSLKSTLRKLTFKEEEGNFSEILNYNRIIFNSILVIILSFNVFVAYGCTLVNVKILPDNHYLSFFILSISELPSNILSYLSVQYLGRRFTGILTSFLTIVFCLVATFYMEDRNTLIILVALIRIFVTQGLYLVYVITSEVVPTPIRSTGMGVAIVAGMIGIAFSPYIVAMSDGNEFQYWVMIGISVGSLIASVLLPETIGLPLPQTYTEANAIGRERPFFKWIHHWNKHNYQQVPTQEPDQETNVC